MKKKVLALGASNSKRSINRQLASYAAGQLKDVDVNLIDLNDYEMPLYSSDREDEGGIPELAQRFKEQIRASDGIVISFAEHNSSFAAAYKNLFDWVSRIQMNVWDSKPLLLLATSPGGRGGANVLKAAVEIYGRMGNSVVDFSLPSFYKNFGDEGITDAELMTEFNTQLQTFQRNLAS